MCHWAVFVCMERNGHRPTEKKGTAVGHRGCRAFLERNTTIRRTVTTKNTPAEQQAMAVISLYGFGWLMGHFGAGAWWGAAGFALIGTLAIWRSWSWPQPDGKVA